MSSAGQSAPSFSGPSQDWQPLLELATREVFEIMLNCKLESRAEPASSPGELTAMVGLAGQLCGLVSLRCSAQSGSLLASRMLGAEMQPADPQVFDAIGEITNMIAGNFKNKLPGIGDKCMLSVPTVITGSDYNCRSLADSAPLQVTMLFEGAPLTIGLEVHS